MLALCVTPLPKASGDREQTVYKVKYENQLQEREAQYNVIPELFQATVSAHNVPSSVCGAYAVFLDAEPAMQLSVHLFKSSMIITLIIIIHCVSERKRVINLFATCLQPLQIVNDIN